MRRDPRAYLWDIQQAADAILRFVAGLDAQIYRDTDVVHSAVERKFEIIGEALSQLSKIEPMLVGRIPDVRQIIAFRNLLIHGYAAIDHERVWRIANSSLPEFHATVVALAEELGRASGSRHVSPNDGVNRTAFARYIGIDYSGAETPTASLKGLRVYLAEGDGSPIEIAPPKSKRRFWSRRGIAEWLVERLADNAPTIVGIDHGFSFPIAYFESHGVAHDWPTFLDDFHNHWPTDGDHIYVDFVREGEVGNGAARKGDSRWRRLTERRAGGAKSVFHFDVPGSVAKSTHSGIPWLRFVRQKSGARVHFWPFDGWAIPLGRSAIVEAYPALWSGRFAPEDRTSDQHDAYSIAAWLSYADRFGELSAFLEPTLNEQESALARVEGWILGVPGSI